MRLSTEQLTRLSRLLDQAIDMDEEARQEWLQGLPPEQRDLEPALRQGLLPQKGDGIGSAAIEALLEGGGAPVAAMAALLERGTAAHVQSEGRLQAGELVGPYRLLRPLGAGGMAEVWLAQRADGAFKREVALKIPVRLERREDLARRFAIERDILAALEHPRIARFYDAGVSQDGRPYLALEYVAGKNLLEWTDEHRLGIRARIELLLQVLEAVAYAHDKGVLHRDIKPSNLLVTNAGQVTLLDFGVAKMVEQPADADLTQVYGRALTPAYASPEHVKGERIDAAGDVYSLGVVLYELLSGRRPDQVEGGAMAPGRTVEPPSTRVDARSAEVRGGNIARIRRTLECDLDAIVLKSLAPSPAGRYQNAAALARDLRRYLAGEMVQAVPPSFAYKAGKFLRRNRVGVSVAAAVAVVIGGMGYALLRVQLTADPPPAEVAAAAPVAPVSPESQPAIERKAHPSVRQLNLEAYKLVLQGDVYSNGPFKRDAERAEVLFKQAIALDPGSALPWVKLGLLYMREAQLAWMPRSEANEQARRAIATALEIEPHLMAARAARFRYLVQVEHQWGDARAELDRMRAIDMSDAFFLPDAEAYFAGVTGNLDEAIKIQTQIVERNPLHSSALGVLAFYLLHNDRLEESLAMFGQELQRNPHAIRNHALIGVVLALLGRGEEALTAIAEERHEGSRLWAAAIAHWAAGRQDESDAAVKTLMEKFAKPSAYSIAQLHAFQGKRNQALEWLTRACIERQSGCELVRIDRFFRALRDEPRYKALLVKMKLSDDGPR